MSNLHPLVTNQNQPQTRMQLINQEAANLNTGTKTIHQLGQELGLQPQQVEFCLQYVNNPIGTGRGAESAVMAYGYDTSNKLGKQNAYNTATRNLKHPQCQTLIDILNDTMGLNDQYVDKRLMEIISDRSDNKTAVLALQEYNKVRNRIKTQQDIVLKPVIDFTAYTPEQLKLLLQLIQLGKIQDNTRDANATELHDNMTAPIRLTSLNAKKAKD